MILSNAHTHSQFCDGKSTMEDMVQSALSKGFVSLGFTPHAVQNFDQTVLQAEKEKAYPAEFKRLKKAYQDKIKLYMGIERDAFCKSDCREYDYILGSVHYILDNEQHFAPVDGSKEGVLHLLQHTFFNDVYALSKKYYDTLCEMVCATPPNIVAHFDLHLKQLRQMIDTKCDKYLTPARTALQCVYKKGCVLEINTGGMARSNQPCPYPELHLLHEFRKMGGEILISSDCHRADLIDTHFDDALFYVKQAGYKEALMLNEQEGKLFRKYIL